MCDCPNCVIDGIMRGPMPPPKDGEIEVTPVVIKLLKERYERGLVKYGKPLMSENGRNNIKDRLEEQLDSVVYTMAEMLERESIDKRMRIMEDALVLIANYSGNENNKCSQDMSSIASATLQKIGVSIEN